MDPTSTSQDTPISSRNTGGTKTDDRNLTDLTFPTSQNAPVFDSNRSKDGDRNSTVSTALTSQYFLLNRVSKNDNNNGEILIDLRTEFETVNTFLMEELHHLRQ